MQGTLIESNGKERIAYESLVLSDLKPLSIFNSKLPLKIVKALAESPAPAIDIARKLKVHEQKIYYHIRKLEKAGIIYPISNERRHGMIAKIYSVVSPVISAKLYDKGIEVKENLSPSLDPKFLEFLSPIISNSRLNAKIIVGDTYSHGKFDKSSDELNYVADLLLFLGKFVDGSESYTSLDVKVKDTDLKNNLILIGNNRTNSIIDKMNPKLPVYFDESGKEALVSKLTGTIYTDPRIGIIVKMKNPFSSNKTLILIGGIGRRGAHAAALAITNYSSMLTASIKNLDDTVKVVKGFDSDGDDVIDSIKIVE